MKQRSTDEIFSRLGLDGATLNFTQESFTNRQYASDWNLFGRKIK